MSYTLVLEWMPGDLYMSAVTARCTAPTSSYSVVWLPPNKVYQITLYCGSTSLVSFLVGAFRGKAWSYMRHRSYEAQVSHYTEYIKSKPEWQMVEIYADDGISGTNTAKRDEFNRMIADCEAGKIDMIITKSISRFSRNTLDCLKYTRKLKALNIAVFFEKENINIMDSKGEVLLTIMASLAQQESESLSANVRMGIQYRNQQGKVQINTTGS